MSQIAIEALLRQKIGLDATLIGSSTIVRAVGRRMAECGLPNAEAYLLRLQTVQEELDELIENVVVPETWFFRDKEPFAFLSRYAISEWLPAHPKGVLRVLSIPCSTGEEPYSIAIALLEAGLSPKNFHIDAVDISQKAILAAQSAVYSKYSFRGDNFALLSRLQFSSDRFTTVYHLRDRYFQQTKAGYQLCQAVKSTVNFIHGNLVDRFFPLDKAPYDVIFCRNLLIYFDRSAREKTIQVCDRLLTKNGLLFVGHSETGQLLASRFVCVLHPLAFAYRKAKAQSSKEAGKLPALDLEWRISKNKIQSKFSNLKPEINRPSPLLPFSPSPTQSSLLENAKDLADRGHLDEAATLCKTYLNQNCFSAEAYLLLGVVHQAGGDEEQAEQCFNKAVYLEPTHYEALIHLALLKEHHGDLTSAAVIRQRIQRLNKL